MFEGARLVIIMLANVNLNVNVLALRDIMLFQLSCRSVQAGKTKQTYSVSKNVVGYVVMLLHFYFFLQSAP